MLKGHAIFHEIYNRISCEKQRRIFNGIKKNPRYRIEVFLCLSSFSPRRTGISLEEIGRIREPVKNSADAEEQLQNVFEEVIKICLTSYKWRF
ncbi:MAG: hypothetical protein HRK26_03355 [Rickettsiaceae bacterium H1]|nr:hypothetical protein [Rickettsiaceae bacterium H1]